MTNPYHECYDEEVSARYTIRKMASFSMDSPDHSSTETTSCIKDASNVFETQNYMVTFYLYPNI